MSKPVEPLHSPVVSICIPAYRQVEFLRRTLESIRDQDFSDYEVIITDDSPDDSVEHLVREFASDARLSYLRNPKALGSPENWNESIRRATGRYIKIMHHDDYFSSAHSLGRFVAMMQAAPDCRFGFCATEVSDVVGRRHWKHSASAQALAGLRDDPGAMLFAGNCIGSPSATIYRRDAGVVFDSRMKWLVDVDFYSRMLTAFPAFACSDEAWIGTPTNAAHQVTEACRDNAAVELGEALMFYEKLAPSSRARAEVIGTWRRLFARYSIRKPIDLARHGVQGDALLVGELFASLPSTPLREHALAWLYRGYMLMPRWLRWPFKLVRAALRSGR